MKLIKLDGISGDVIIDAEKFVGVEPNGFQTQLQSRSVSTIRLNGGARFDVFGDPDDIVEPIIRGHGIDA